MTRCSWSATLSLVIAVLHSAIAAAQPDFYTGKQIDMFVGTPVGGGYDQYGRLLGRHMGRHIPGHPQIVIKNMPAGGGRQAMNHIYTIAPQDGTAIGTTIRNVPFDPLFGETATRIDALKLTWLGSLNNEIPVCVSWTPPDVVETAKQISSGR